MPTYHRLRRGFFYESAGKTLPSFTMLFLMVVLAALTAALCLSACAGTPAQAAAGTANGTDGRSPDGGVRQTAAGDGLHCQQVKG
jgi:hypothetical protein